MITRYSIVTLVLFFVSTIFVIQPVSIHVNLPVLGRKRLTLGLMSAPTLAIAILWASQCLGTKHIYNGIFGTNDIKPYNILILFISLAYVAIALDVTGILRAAAFWVSTKGSSGWNLFLKLHIILAHHLHCSSLLDKFIRNIEFIEETENPFMTTVNFPHEMIKENRTNLKRECKTLKQEVNRLEANLHMQERRLKNVTNLVFSRVNIADSKDMEKLTEAAVRDSAATKQIAYLAMIFLYTTFVADVFGMNVSGINLERTATLLIYIAVTLPLTVFTVWMIVAFQSRYIFKENAPFWQRLAWPFILAYRWMMGLPVTFPRNKLAEGGFEREPFVRGTDDEDRKSGTPSITIAIDAGSPGQ